jgi:hypothetical protein
MFLQELTVVVAEGATMGRAERLPRSHRSYWAGLLQWILFIFVLGRRAEVRLLLDRNGWECELKWRVSAGVYIVMVRRRVI